MRNNRASLGRRDWGYPRHWTATLEMSLGDFGEQVLHMLVSVIKILDSLFNGGDERLFALPRRLGMDTVAFSSVGMTEEKNDRKVRNSAGRII